MIEILSDANLGREMHSVISQGRVEEIVLSAPRDRRLLVEEAAGLGKHRKRRRRTQLKLERTQDNLDRALDVEREARKSLRPLKRQAEAADIHARLERQAAELRAQLLASELCGHEAELAGAEARAAEARQARGVLDERLGEVAKVRAGVEEQLAGRETERTEAWGRLTAIRAAHERLTVRAEALGARRADLVRGLDRRRAMLGALAEELGAGSGAEGDPTAAGIERVGEALADAVAALDAARGAGDDRRARHRAGEGARGGRARGPDGAQARGHARRRQPGLAGEPARARGGADRRPRRALRAGGGHARRGRRQGGRD